MLSTLTLEQEKKYQEAIYLVGEPNETKTPTVKIYVFIVKRKYLKEEELFVQRDIHFNQKIWLNQMDN